MLNMDDQPNIALQKEKNNFLLKAGRIIILIFVPVITAMGFIYIYLFDPEKNGELFLSCPVYRFTGFYCPADGNTRALHALVHFDIFGMLKNNLLFPFLLFILAWLFIGEYLHLLLRRRILWFPKQFKLRWVWIGVSVAVLFTVLRNIPVYPFSLLAPGGWRFYKKFFDFLLNLKYICLRIKEERFINKKWEKN